ncbi:hypothetical protein LINPERHAP2_LOCUS25437, partial [Linum perenne]
GNGVGGTKSNSWWHNLIIEKCGVGNFEWKPVWGLANAGCSIWREIVQNDSIFWDYALIDLGVGVSPFGLILGLWVLLAYSIDYFPLWRGGGGKTSLVGLPVEPCSPSDLPWTSNATPRDGVLPRLGASPSNSSSKLLFSSFQMV